MNDKSRKAMKRTCHIKERVLDLDNLYLAYCKARRGKQQKQEVIDFAANLDANIIRLRDALESGNISLGRYRFFTIHDPKERLICAAPFCERVVHHAVMNVCHNTFDRTLIDTTYATRRGKGVYAALDKAKQGMARYAYTVKLDVRKYYDSVSHDVLKARLRRMFKDPWLLSLFDHIIDRYGDNGKGLPIGNLTSQYFANLYISDLDHKAKEQWKVPVYIRYMDDMLLMSDDKSFLRHCVDALTEYARNELQLTLKPPVYRQSKDGQNFLGYKIMPYHILLSGRSKRRFRTKMLRYDSLYGSGQWDEQTLVSHVKPLLAFTQHAECARFRKSVLQKCKT